MPSNRSTPRKFLILEGTPPSPADRKDSAIIQDFFLRKVVLAVGDVERKSFRLSDEDYQKLLTIWPTSTNIGYPGWVSKWMEVPPNAY